MKVVLAGGGGFIGRSLWPHFCANGHEVVVLRRQGSQNSDRVRLVQWDGKSIGPWARELENADVLINLAGRSVNCRYTAKNRREIYDSRLLSTRALAMAVAACRNPPPLWINSASATIYRHAEDRPMDDASGEIGTGFSVDVCRQWERALEEAHTPDTRKIALRMAMVMGPEPGGVFTAFRLLSRLGLGGTMGSGTQYMSWLHHEDLYGILEWIRTHPGICGAINASAPNPLPNAEFMKIMREVCGCSLGLPAARWMLEVGAFLLRKETELLLKSRRVVPSFLLESGYRFRFPAFPHAARDIEKACSDRHVQRAM